MNKVIKFLLTLFFVSIIFGEQFCYAEEDSGRGLVVYSEKTTPIAEGVSFRGIIPFGGYDDGISIKMEGMSSHTLAPNEITKVTLVIENKGIEPFIINGLSAESLFVNGEYSVGGDCDYQLLPGSECRYSFQGTVVSGSLIGSHTHIGVEYKIGRKMMPKILVRPWPKMLSSNDLLDFSIYNELSFKNISEHRMKILGVIVLPYLVIEENYGELEEFFKNAIVLNPEKKEVNSDDIFMVSIPAINRDNIFSFNDDTNNANGDVYTVVVKYLNTEDNNVKMEKVFLRNLGQVKADSGVNSGEKMQIDFADPALAPMIVENYVENSPIGEAENEVTENPNSVADYPKHKKGIYERLLPYCTPKNLAILGVTTIVVVGGLYWYCSSSTVVDGAKAVNVAKAAAAEAAAEAAAAAAAEKAAANAAALSALSPSHTRSGLGFKKWE
ncbi:MAG: hypothetical protein KKE11_04480 [Gammaproteobacteria bacterium]|nr:hypothetical protein [Gammaproteobacteria bacterium]